MYVKRYIRPKYAKKNGDGVLIGSLPSRPIEKGIPGPGLLSHIMISKYVDHLPLYRQQQQFRRHGVEISESTLNNWVKCTYELLLPLYELYRKRILSQDYIMVDETYIKVLDRNKKGKTHQGYFWSYYDPLGKEVYFDYRKSRSRAGPEEMLNGFHGYLQTDGYTVYDEISHDKGITLLNCMAHARRYYDKSLLNDRKRSEWMLKKIMDRLKKYGYTVIHNYDWNLLIDAYPSLPQPVIDMWSEGLCYLIDYQRTLPPGSPAAKKIEEKIAYIKKAIKYRGYCFKRQ